MTGDILQILSILISDDASEQQLEMAWEAMRPFASKILYVCRLTPDLDLDLDENIESGTSQTEEPWVLKEWIRSALDEMESIYASRFLGHTLSIQRSSFAPMFDSGSITVDGFGTTDDSLHDWITGLCAHPDHMNQAGNPISAIQLILDETAFVETLRMEHWDRQRPSHCIINSIPLSSATHSEFTAWTENLKRVLHLSEEDPPDFPTFLARDSCVSIAGCIQWSTSEKKRHWAAYDIQLDHQHVRVYHSLYSESDSMPSESLIGENAVREVSLLAGVLFLTDVVCCKVFEPIVKTLLKRDEGDGTDDGSSQIEELTWWQYSSHIVVCDLTPQSLFDP